MKINAFFSNRLGSPLHNHVWSWGAVDSASNRVFLRTNEEHIFDDDNGDWVLAYDPGWNPSPGHNERLNHIKMIESGAIGYAVVYRMNSRNKIEWFDDQTVLKLGAIVNEDGLIYCKVEGEHSIDDLVRSGVSMAIANDVAILARHRDKTTRMTLVAARLGQGDFRDAVLRLWGYKCSVTEICTKTAIIASHIKPWQRCTNDERIDPYNGLPLAGTLDRLFDAGLISFGVDRKIMISPQLSTRDAEILGLRDMELNSTIPTATKQYLKYHHERVFKTQI